MPTEPRQFDDVKRHAIYLRDGYRCAYSGYVDKTCTGKRLSLDHINPVHLGGDLQNKRSEPADNLVSAQCSTNFAKADRTKEQWSEYAAKSQLSFSWPKIEGEAKPPPALDLVRGAQLSKLAKQSRDARRLDSRGKRTIETPKSRALAEQSQKIVAEYQAEQAATKVAPEQKPTHVGPGVKHDPHTGQFTSDARSIN